MKKYLFILVIIAFGFTLNHFFDEKVKSLLSLMHLTEDHAQMTIFSNLSGPSFYIPSTSELKKIAKGERPSLVLVAADYIKQTTKSPGFIKQYNQYREIKKPFPPQKPQSVNEMKENYRKQLLTSISESEKLIEQVPNMKDALEETIKNMKQQLADLDNPDNPMFGSATDESNNLAYEQQLEIYKQKLVEWEKEYPENNPNNMIKKWLNTFLEISSSVDYDAETKDVGGKIVFVNPNYERKDYMWKFCYRAGKETVETARSFAKTWLNEL